MVISLPLHHWLYHAPFPPKVQYHTRFNELWTTGTVWWWWWSARMHYSGRIFMCSLVWSIESRRTTNLCYCTQESRHKRYVSSQAGGWVLIGYSNHGAITSTMADLVVHRPTIHSILFTTFEKNSLVFVKFSFRVCCWFEKRFPNQNDGNQDTF